MRVAIAGTGRLGVAIIEPILKSPEHEVVALLMNGRNVHGFQRRRNVWINRMLPKSESPVPWAAATRAPLIWLDKQSEDELAAIRATEPDLLITCGFSIILKRPSLELPSIGCINVHSSLLPKHRGPCPFNHVILANEHETGVTFHVTAEGIDSGDILDQTAFPIGPNDRAFDVYNKAAEVSRERILEVLAKIERQGLSGEPQDDAAATYDPKITVEQLKIDWSRSAAELHRWFRSCMPYEQIYFTHEGRAIRDMRAKADEKAVDAAPGTVVANRPGVRIATGHGTFTILAGMTSGRVPLLWPMPWNRPAVGDVLA